MKFGTIRTQALAADPEKPLRFRLNVGNKRTVYPYFKNIESNEDNSKYHFIFGWEGEDEPLAGIQNSSLFINGTHDIVDANLGAYLYYNMASWEVGEKLEFVGLKEEKDILYADLFLNKEKLAEPLPDDEEDEDDLEEEEKYIHYESPGGYSDDD